MPVSSCSASEKLLFGNLLFRKLKSNFMNLEYSPRELLLLTYFVFL